MSGSRGRYSVSRHCSGANRSPSVDRVVGSASNAADDDMPSPRDSSGSVTRPPDVATDVPGGSGTQPATKRTRCSPLSVAEAKERDHNGGRTATTFEFENGVLIPTDKVSTIMREHAFSEEIQVNGFNWSSLDYETIETYWLEFKKYARWTDTPTKWVKAAWASLAAESYRQYVHNKIRGHFLGKKDGYPEGCNDEVWASFLAHWETDTFRIMSANNKKARGDLKMNYTGGRTSVRSYSQKLASKNLPCDTYSSFLYAWTVNHDGVTFKDEKSKKISETVNELKVRYNEQGFEISIDDVYLEAADMVGGISRGRVAGLGKGKRHFYGDAGTPSVASTQSRLRAENASLRRDLNQMDQRLSQVEIMFGCVGATQPNLGNTIGSQPQQSQHSVAPVIPQQPQQSHGFMSGLLTSVMPGGTPCMMPNGGVPSMMPMQYYSYALQVPIHQQAAPSHVPTHQQAGFLQVPVHQQSGPSQFPVHQQAGPSQFPVHQLAGFSQVPVHHQVGPSQVPIHQQVIPSQAPEPYIPAPPQLEANEWQPDFPEDLGRN